MSPCVPRKIVFCKFWWMAHLDPIMYLRFLPNDHDLDGDGFTSRRNRPRSQNSVLWPMKTARNDKIHEF